MHESDTYQCNSSFLLEGSLHYGTIIISTKRSLILYYTIKQLTIFLVVDPSQIPWTHPCDPVIRELNVTGSVSDRLLGWEGRVCGLHCMDECGQLRRENPAIGTWLNQTYGINTITTMCVTMHSNGSNVLFSHIVKLFYFNVVQDGVCSKLCSVKDLKYCNFSLYNFRFAWEIYILYMFWIKYILGF